MSLPHSLLLLGQAAANAPGYMGRIQGGWDYVWAAYGISWAALALYSLSLWFRRRGAQQPKDI